MSNSAAPTAQALPPLDAIDQLRPTERALLDLSVRHDMDDEEIGAIVGLDPEEVTRLRQDALDRLSSGDFERHARGNGHAATAVAQPPAPAAAGEAPAPAIPASPAGLGDRPPILTPGLARPRRRRWPFVLAAAAILLVAAGVTALVSGRLGGNGQSHGAARVARHAAPAPAVRPALKRSTGNTPHDIYAADRPGNLSPVVRNFPERIYVPNSRSNSVDVIDPHTFRVVDHFSTDALPQHVTPAWNLRKLWVLNDVGNSLTPIDPRTGHHGKPVHVDDPYNMYYTPDGRYAIVVAEQLQRLDFRKPKTMKLHKSVRVPCFGVDHMDFTADGRYLLASCEFSGQMVLVDVEKQELVKTIGIRPGAMPQDVKLSPDGKTFYVADMASNGVWMIGSSQFRVRGFIQTGRGAHGLYASRDSRSLYVSNRGEGSISIISFKKRKVVNRWVIPGGGSPDMGGVSTDGKVLWLTGRYNAEVYAISTEDGHLIKRIKVGLGPHGLCVYPQPGRYSLGHTGVFR